MRNRHTQKFLAGCIASLFIFAAGAASATTYIGGNIIMSGTTIDVLGPHADLDIQAIIDSITDASETKPYLIKLGAGVYDLGVGQILMKNGVSIQGAGRDSTHIVSAPSGFISASQTVILIEGAMKSTSLTDVSVINNGGDDFAYGILHRMSGDFRIERASIHASNANVATGISSDATGVDTPTPPTLILNSVDLEASSTTNARGLEAIRTKTVMHDVKAVADGTGSSSYGMYFANTTDTSIGSNVTAIAESGGWGLGVTDASVFLQSSALSGGSTITAGALRLLPGSDETEIANTRIQGYVEDDVPGIKNCFGNYDEEMKEVRC